MEHDSIKHKACCQEKEKKSNRKEEWLVLKEEKDKDRERQLVLPEIKLGCISLKKEDAF